MSRMRRVEPDTAAAGKPCAGAGRADEYQRRSSGVDAHLIERFPGWIAGGGRARTRNGKAAESRACTQAALELVERRFAGFGIDVNPIADHAIRIRALVLEGVIVNPARLFAAKPLVETKIQDHANAAGAEVFGLLLFRIITWLRAPGFHLLGELLRGAQHVAAPRSPVRVHVDQFHLAVACDSITSRSLPFCTLPVGVRGRSSTSSSRSGSLYFAICGSRNARISSNPNVIPGRTTTQATTCSPVRGCGVPITAQSAMAGCLKSTSSISRG